MALLLASQSPRRRALLALLTNHFDVLAPEVDESNFVHLPALELCESLAIKKVDAIPFTGAYKAVLACDTVVDLEGRALGKPQNCEDAINMLSSLSGRWHEVHTGVCLLQHNGRRHNFTQTTRVWFDTIPKSDILAVCETDEPYDKAGAYGIQGWAAGFIPRIEGCYYNVMGLPVATLRNLLTKENLL